MKNLFSFIAIFYTTIRLCYAFKIPLVHSVFVSNIVDPNDHEIEELSNLLAFPLPFEDNSKWSLISRMGLVVNYSVVFSSKPDDISTIRALDLEHYSKDYFQSLVTKHSTNETKGASLKGLRKALEISSTPSIIFMAINTQTEDTDVLNGIITTMKKKLNPVILLQIDKKASISKRRASESEINFEEAVVQTIFHQIHEPWDSEYHYIAKASESALYAMVAKIFAELNKPWDMKYTFQDSNEEKAFIFIYDLINATENDLNRVSNSMLTHLQSPHNVSSHYSIVFSSRSNTYSWSYRINISENYTENNFQEIIKSQTNNLSLSGSLQSLLTTLKSCPPYSQIVYYVNGEPEGEHEILSQILQEMIDKGIEVTIYAYGNLSAYHLPVVYRTILDANKFTKFRSGNQILEPGNNFLPETDE